jgi:dinuclear metal center YbgI/SA1388 family protein
MKLGPLLEKIERALPLSWAEDWDNPGLAAGDLESKVSRVAVALDVTERTVNDAADNGCELLITHHPIIFKPLGSLRYDRPAPAAIRAAIKRDVALYSAHTNWDSSPHGTNVVLARLLGLEHTLPLAAPAAENGAYGMGVIGELGAAVPLEDFIAGVKMKWRLSRCEAFGGADRKVKRVAVGGGSCGSMWPIAAAKGADVFVTADLSYHDRQDAFYSGLAMAVADHGEMEKATMPALAALVKRESGLPVFEAPFEIPPRIFC